MPLTTAQIQTLKTFVFASTDPAIVDARTRGDTVALATQLNATATPAYIVWKTLVHKNDVGKTFVASALAAITAGNNDKLANFAAWNETVDPSRADQRQFFDDIFSVAAGASTRAALLALWKRLATVAEKQLATGAGSDASPSAMAFEGSVTQEECQRILAA